MKIQFYKSQRLTEAGFPVHGFTQIAGGVSDGPYRSLNLAFDVGDSPERVIQNREQLRRALAVDVPLATVEQVHGTNIVDASTVSDGEWRVASTTKGDAIVTSSSEVLAVRTADCAAVLLADPQSRLVAAIHAGWRGTAKGIIRKSVRKMAELGGNTSSLLAVIGPCIGPCCYEVGEDVARALPESADPIKKRPGKYLLDLPNAVEVSLIIAGIPSSQIETIRECTHCHSDTLFSYRRSGGTCGRMFGFISNSSKNLDSSSR